MLYYYRHHAWYYIIIYIKYKYIVYTLYNIGLGSFTSEIVYRLQIAEYECTIWAIQ